MLVSTPEALPPAERILVVEDRIKFARHLKPLLDAAALDCSSFVADHDAVLADPAAYAHADLVLLDSLCLSRNQDRQPADPVRPVFAALEVIDALRTVAEAPRIIAYSGSITDPAVNIPLWEQRDVVRARMATQDLLRYPSAILTAVPQGAMPDPVAVDYEHLGVGPDAQLTKAVRATMGRRDAWEWVTTDRRTEKTRKWVQRNLVPLLGRDCVRSGRHAIGVVRRIARVGPDSLGASA